MAGLGPPPSPPLHSYTLKPHKSRLTGPTYYIFVSYPTIGGGIPQPNPLCLTHFLQLTIPWVPTTDRGGGTRQPLFLIPLLGVRFDGCAHVFEVRMTLAGLNTQA